MRRGVSARIRKSMWVRVLGGRGRGCVEWVHAWCTKGRVPGVPCHPHARHACPLAQPRPHLWMTCQLLLPLWLGRATSRLQPCMPLCKQCRAHACWLPVPVDGQGAHVQAHVHLTRSRARAWAGTSAGAYIIPAAGVPDKSREVRPSKLPTSPGIPPESMLLQPVMLSDCSSPRAAERWGGGRWGWGCDGRGGVGPSQGDPRARGGGVRRKAEGLAAVQAPLPPMSTHSHTHRHAQCAAVAYPVFGAY